MSYSPHSAAMTSGTVSIFSQRYALLPQNSSASSIFPSAALISAFVMQYGVVAGSQCSRHLDLDRAFRDTL